MKILSKKFQIKNKYIRSMRFVISLLLIVIGIFPIVIVNYIQIDSMRDKMVSQKTDRIMSQCNMLGNKIVSEGYMENTSVELVNAELAQFASMYNGRILIVDKNFRIIQDTYSMDVNKMCISSSVIRSSQGELVSKYDDAQQYIEIAMPLKFDKEVIGTLLVSFSTADIEDALSSVQYRVGIVDLIIMVIIVAGAIFIAKLMVKPFVELQQSIEDISDGYLDKKIQVKGYTETMQIGEAFNQMLAQIKKVDDSRQEFVSNVSHELKTPMTSIKVLADSLIMQEDVPAELYREFMSDIVEEIDRENDIISDLLTLVKMDKKSADLNITEVNINEMVELILKRLRPIAANKNIELVIESFRPIIAQVDEVKLTSAITNLVENAIKYNVLDGWVHVSLNADHKYFYVKVEDSGIGIPEESQEMIFDRFYRVDKTRSRETGGTGLGLAITKNIILMHRGAVKVYSKENEGTTFTVRIPLNYVKVVKISRSSVERKKNGK
ncbi:MAG: two-component sensor histidine kinase [Lachnospiraceae bacterium]|nr:two-component sensor histidine kinase [Lachnospiraceae bacterium]